MSQTCKDYVIYLTLQLGSNNEQFECHEKITEDMLVAKVTLKFNVGYTYVKVIH